MSQDDTKKMETSKINKGQNGRMSKRLRPQGPKTPEFVRKDEGSVRIKKEQSFAGNCVHWNHVAG
jgi:hypothetical protein